MSSANHRIPSRHAAQLQQHEADCVKLAQEHKALTEGLQTLLRFCPVSKPDGLDINQHPNLFAFLGKAREERAHADYVNASDGWQQDALLSELKNLL